MRQSRTIRSLHCPACSGLTSHRLLFSKHGCDILRCESCGLGRADTSGFEPNAYYTDDYFSGGHADGYADYRASEPVLRREFAREVKFIRSFRSAGRMLEIGCAYGFFLEEARPFFEVVGIEIAEGAAAECRRRGLSVVTGIASPEVLGQLGTFDVIVMLDVIEHLPDPRATLGLCARHLNSGGSIVLTTGDFASPVARLAAAGWRLMTPPQHLWYLTPESFRRLSAQFSLRFTSLDHPWKLVPLSLIVFQLGRMVGRRGAASSRGAGIAVPVNLFDAMRVVLTRGESQ